MELDFSKVTLQGLAPNHMVSLSGKQCVKSGSLKIATYLITTAAENNSNDSPKKKRLVVIISPQQHLLFGHMIHQVSKIIT